MTDRLTRDGRPLIQPTVDPFETTAEDGDRKGVDPFEATGEICPIPDVPGEPDSELPEEFSEDALADTVTAAVAPEGLDLPAEDGETTTSAAACPKCRFVSDEGARYCVHCGADMHGTPQVTQARSRTDPAPPSADAPLLPFTPPVAPSAGAGRCTRCEEPVPATGPSCPGCGEPLGDPVVLVSISPDGSEGERLPAIRGAATLGRGDADRSFPEDAYLSPVHVRIVVTPHGVTAEDLKSLNGTFVRLRRPGPLGPGDTFVVGRQLLRLEAVGRAHVSTVGKDGTRLLGSPPPDGDFVLVQLSASGRVQDRYHLPSGGAVLGRDRGEVRFPGDRYVSGRHAKISVSRGRATLTDLGSSNGTWLRVRKPTSLDVQDEIYLGSQVFRLLSAEGAE